MQKLLLLILLFCSNFIHSSQINGHVSLDNVSNKNGTIIKFKPLSPSSVYIETISDSKGFFHTTVTNGLYNIVFEKIGFKTCILKNQFISKNSSLENVTLCSNKVIDISGEIFGNWKNTYTYVINSNSTIPKGETLNIEHGTEIKFNGYHSIIVNGNINAIGNKTSYIRFTSNKLNPTNKDWNQIKINATSTKSKMKFCIVEYGKRSNGPGDGIINISGKLNIENCIIQHSDQTGIYAKDNSTDLNISNNNILDCKYGIHLETNKKINIRGNKISNIHTSGIIVGTHSNSVKISNNRISNCEGYGIHSWSSILINNNVLFGIGSKLNIYSIMIIGGQPEIRNNTIFNNSCGIGITGSDFFNPQPIIDSNIFYNNTYFGIRSEGNSKPKSVKYNLFKDNGFGIGNNLPNGVGTIITTNINGSDSDTFFNIFPLTNLRPLNSSITNSRKLKLNSDAINAGNPLHRNKIDASIIDIGANDFSGNIKNNQISGI
jgi:parallel beta-helix repeat protein